ncbi:hypothetical protein [Niveibacterium terrae]|uniref:hypothetical protein n=1 Tax=Niveibacterium terrae TaxID=3373598 RepID=UPI003A913DBA
MDAPFVDDMLKTILETLASEGMIALPGGKAVLPAQEKLASGGGTSTEIHS